MQTSTKPRIAGTNHTIRAGKTYRAIQIPKGTPADQIEIKADRGELPYLQFQAVDSIAAATTARMVSGLPVLRIDRVAG